MIRRAVMLLGLLTCAFSVSSAQNRAYFRIRERAVVRFDWGCTKPALFPKHKFQKLVGRLIPADWPMSMTYGDRAYGYDLNGDGTAEYFVPLYCGATGNCFWAILSRNPSRLLGVVSGESIYVHRRIARWSRISISSHLTVSDSGIDTLSVRRGRYRKFGRGTETSAYRNDFPRSLLKVEPLCNPHYVSTGGR